VEGIGLALPNPAREWSVTETACRRSTAICDGEIRIALSRHIVLLLTGYYNGKRNNTIIQPQTIKQEEEKVNSYCYQHRETTLMDAVKNVLGFDK
jgi:HdeA/HdeB family